MTPFTWVSPKTVVEAAAAASVTVAGAMTAADDVPAHAGRAILKAGGIDVLDLLKEGVLVADTVVTLKELPTLTDIRAEAGGGVRIGATATLASLAAHPLVRRRYPALAGAVAGSASPQIRNVATIGGNLLQRPHCWYFRAAEYRCLRKGGEHCFAISGENQYHAIFDNRPCAIVHPSSAATALVALGASIEITGASGTVRRVTLEEFFGPPDQDVTRENGLQVHEVLTSVLLPPVSPGVRMAYMKQGEKDSFDWPLAEVAVAFELDARGHCRDSRVVLGAAAPVPHRATAAESTLNGRHLDEPLIREAARRALDGATPLAKNDYKLPLFETLVRRTLLAAMEIRHG